MKNGLKTWSWVVMSVTGICVLISAILLIVDVSGGISFGMSGADGPTSVFMAGKVGDAHLFYGFTLLLAMVSGVLWFARKRSA